MINKIAATAFVALITVAPLGALAPAYAQSSTPAAAPAAHTPTGSHRSHLRRQGVQSRERARASAEHVRKMRHTAPATTAPKS
jgi:hypothetical protein